MGKGDLARERIVAKEAPIFNRSGFDPDATATVIVSMLESALMIARLQHSDSALKQVREYLVGFLEALAE